MAENRRKRIALFGNNFTSRYKRGLCRAFTLAAGEFDIDLVIFNTYGKIGTRSGFNEDYETEILDYFDLEQFDGVVFEGEGYNVVGMSESIEKRLRALKCPVISISSHIEGFYNIRFDDSGGLRNMVDHLIEHHHFSRIAYFSGPFDHPDARSRLAEFREVMKDHGLPENGVGMFEGDFWFNMGNEAAHYFLSLPERPEAIVCANDYMAISLINNLRKFGVGVPEDMVVTGYDGTVEGREYLPHLTSVTRERTDIAYKSLKLLVDLIDDPEKTDFDLSVTPKLIRSQSCGCEPLDYQHVLDFVSTTQEENRMMGTYLYESESAMVKLNMVTNIREMEAVFKEDSVNFGEYSSFFMMVHADKKGIPMFDSSFSGPSGAFIPVIWVDKNNEYLRSPHYFNRSLFIPPADSDRPHVYYIMSVHCADKLFGYSIVEMCGKEIFTEYHNVWLHNLGIILNALQKEDRIHKLINKLEGLSITDGLTGMLNRRGFEDRSRNRIADFHETKTICTMVIDMDGLKKINDIYGHHEGDRSIKALADIIQKSCINGEIAGRVGGDEFYLFAEDYSETALNRLIDRLLGNLRQYNESESTGSYQLSFSYGAYLVQTDSRGQLDDFIKISDQRMYEQKTAKKEARK